MSDDLYRCYHCRALHTYEVITQSGKCRKCSSRRFINALQVEDEEVPVLERMGYDWKSAGWEKVDDPDRPVQQ